MNIPTFLSNLTLTAFHTEIASNQDYSKLVLNVLYSHTAIQWQTGKNKRYRYLLELFRASLLCINRHIPVLSQHLPPNHYGCYTPHCNPHRPAYLHH